MENNELKKALKDSKDLLKKIEAGLKKDVNNAQLKSSKRKLEKRIKEFEDEIAEDTKKVEKGVKKTAKKVKKMTEADFQKAKNEIKQLTGKTEAECEAIIEKYRDLRKKANVTRKAEEKAKESNKKRIDSLRKSDDLISGTTEKSAGSVLETTANRVEKKIDKELEKTENKAKREAEKQVKSQKNITEQEKTKIVKEKVEEKVKAQVQKESRQYVADTLKIVESVSKTLKNYNPEEARTFLLKLRSAIDKLLQQKFEVGGEIFTQPLQVRQGALDSFSVNYERGGKIAKDYVLDRYFVYVERDSYEEGVLENVNNWSSSDFYDNNKSFSSKSALMKFIKGVIERDTQDDNIRDDFFNIETDGDLTTIDYSVLCRYYEDYGFYQKAKKEEIERWKKGELELFSVGVTFLVEVYERRVRAEFAKGGRMKRQGFNDKLDESLGMRRGKESRMRQSMKDRRDESKGMEKAMGRRAYASVGTMDKGRRMMAKGGEIIKIEKINEIKKKYPNLEPTLAQMDKKLHISIVSDNKAELDKVNKEFFRGNAIFEPYTDDGSMLNLLSPEVFAKGGRMKRQGFNDKLDESLGMRRGKESRMRQSMKDRRDESKGMEKAMDRRAYASVGTMDKGRRMMKKGGKSETFIQDVTKSPDFKKGAFTKKAKQRGISTTEFMNRVLSNPKKYDMTTRRQAQFMKNITK